MSEAEKESGYQRASRLFDLVDESVSATATSEEAFTLVIGLVGLIARQLGFTGSDQSTEEHRLMLDYLHGAIDDGFEIGVTEGRRRAS